MRDPGNEVERMSLKLLFMNLAKLEPSCTHESTAQKLSFEWSHTRVPSTDWTENILKTEIFWNNDVVMIKEFFSKTNSK